MIQVSILRRDFPGNGQRILPQDSTPLQRTLPYPPPLHIPTSCICPSLSGPRDSYTHPPTWKLLSGDSTSNADRCTLSSPEDDIRRN